MKKFFLLNLILACSFLLTNAQTTFQEMCSDLNKTGGIYYAYPTEIADNTPAPKGYKPFHISHYGRHGSRYLIGDRDYTSVLSLLQRADSLSALTPLGKNVKEKVETLMLETEGRGGDLSPLGHRQHHDIAARMYENYPGVFTNDAYITARSTLVPRCILSMASFTESLKERNPRLKINTESSNRNMIYMCHSTPQSDEFNGKNGWWNEAYRKFVKRKINPNRLVSSIFSDSIFIDRYVNPEDFIWAMHWLASDSQNTEGKIDFFNIFTNEERFALWECFNALFYAQHADFKPSNGVHLQNAANLLNNIINTADEAIEMSNPSAALRFGHDGNVIPLTSLMGLEGCDAQIENLDDIYKGWCDWKVSPMGANIQMIFYRNPKLPDKVIVKFLHNEKETRIPVQTDMWPYYDWNEVKTYFKSRIKE